MFKTLSHLRSHFTVIILRLREVWCDAVITFLKLSPSQSNGWDPDEMFKYNEETYGVKSTYDSSLSSYT